MVQPIMSVFGLVKDFTVADACEWYKYYWHYSIYISVFYVITIFSIKRYMLDRPKYNLHIPLMYWSLFLAVFSIIGFIKTGVHHWSYLVAHGWRRSVCDMIIFNDQRGLWTFLFCFSKAPELLDTYFIVLRKQKLIFLHWYHHTTVLLYCWYSYAEFLNASQYYVTMNFFVHSIMYSYYALRASGIYRPPVWINMVITFLQLLQMVVGVSVNVYVFINMMMDPSWYCDGKIETTFFYVFLTFAMYASYFILFTEFFYSSYISKKSVKKPEKSSKSDNVLTQNVIESVDFYTADKASLNYAYGNPRLKQRVANRSS